MKLNDVMNPIVSFVALTGALQFYLAMVDQGLDLPNALGVAAVLSAVLTGLSNMCKW